MHKTAGGKMQLTKGQKEGVAWIMQGLTLYKGVILADRMGYGKTAQAIEVLKTSLDRGPALIICPSYVVLKWKDELELWGIQDSICIIDSSKQLLHDSSIYITSYDMASKYEKVFKQLFKKKYSLIICDESHYLKSWNSLRSRRILGTKKAKVTNLLNKTENILCLTGTPVLNRLDELYNVGFKIAPKALKNASKEQFMTYFSEHIRPTPWGTKYEGVKHEKKLQKLVQNFVLCRQEIKGLPDRVDVPMPLQLKGKDIEKFIKEEKALIQKYNITEDDIYKLQKHDKLEGGRIAEIRQQLSLLKIPFFIQALQDHFEKEDQCLIYCYHKKVQEEILHAIQTKCKGRSVGVINGTVSMKKRHTIIKQYQEKKLNIILATIGALKEGVDITAGNTIMFLELDWTPANIEQAIARKHRKGQKRTVFVYYFYFKAGIDRYIMKLLEKKSKIIKKIFGG